MWRREAPVVFRKTNTKSVPQQFEFLKRAAPRGSRAHELLDLYVNGGESLWMNKYFRGISMDEISASERNELRRKTSILNRLIRDAPISKHNMILFRAISEDAPKLKRYHVGDDADFINKGIISTSISYEAAKKFLEDGETCCMLIILVPKQTHMLEVLDNSAWSEEQEVLLPHGSKFRVLKTGLIDGITTFYCILTSQATFKRG